MCTTAGRGVSFKTMLGGAKLTCLYAARYRLGDSTGQRAITAVNPQAECDAAHPRYPLEVLYPARPQV